MAGVSVLGRASRRAIGLRDGVDSGGTAPVEVIAYTPKEGARRMRNIARSPVSMERRIAEADHLLREILIRGGYGETAEVYDALLAMRDAEVVL